MKISAISAYRQSPILAYRHIGTPLGNTASIYPARMPITNIPLLLLWSKSQGKLLVTELSTVGALVFLVASPPLKQIESKSKQLRARPLIIWGGRGPDFRDRNFFLGLPLINFFLEMLRTNFFFQFGPRPPQMINGRPLRDRPINVLCV